MRNFLTHLIFFIFLEFFSENVLKTLLWGCETTRKKSWVVFEKSTFFDKKFEKMAEKKNCAKFFDNFFLRFSQKISSKLF